MDQHQQEEKTYMMRPPPYHEISSGLRVRRVARDSLTGCIVSGPR